MWVWTPCVGPVLPVPGVPAGVLLSDERFAPYRGVVLGRIPELAVVPHGKPAVRSGKVAAGLAGGGLGEEVVALGLGVNNPPGWLHRELFCS
jgi:hypothetical protein